MDLDLTQRRTESQDWVNFEEASAVWRTECLQMGSVSLKQDPPSRVGEVPVVAYEVRALSFLRYTHCLQPLLLSVPKHSPADTIMLAVMPMDINFNAKSDIHTLKSHFWVNGHVVCHKGESCGRAFVPRTLNPSFNPEIVRRWLDYCQSRHRGGVCGPPQPNTFVV